MISILIIVSLADTDGIDPKEYGKIVLPKLQWRLA
jgi:hypothetical protein